MYGKCFAVVSYRLVCLSANNPHNSRCSRSSIRNFPHRGSSSKEWQGRHRGIPDPLIVAGGEELADIASEGNPEEDNLVGEDSLVEEDNRLGVDTLAGDTEGLLDSNFGQTCWRFGYSSNKTIDFFKDVEVLKKTKENCTVAVVDDLQTEQDIELKRKD